MPRYLTKESIAEIKALYQEGADVAELAETYGAGKKAIFYHVNNYADRRRAKIAADQKIHTCPHCRRRLPPMKGMIFCCFCAADIRTPAQKTAAGLNEVLKSVSTYYPQNLRDEAIAVLNDAIKILKEVD